METGRMALNADGSCTVRVGNLVVLGTAVCCTTFTHDSSVHVDVPRGRKCLRNRALTVRVTIVILFVAY